MLATISQISIQQSKRHIPPSHAVDWRSTAITSRSSPSSSGLKPIFIMGMRFKIILAQSELWFALLKWPRNLSHTPICWMIDTNALTRKDPQMLFLPQCFEPTPILGTRNSKQSSLGMWPNTRRDRSDRRLRVIQRGSSDLGYGLFWSKFHIYLSDSKLS